MWSFQINSVPARLALARVYKSCSQSFLMLSVLVKVTYIICLCMIKGECILHVCVCSWRLMCLWYRLLYVLCAIPGMAESAFLSLLPFPCLSLSFLHFLLCFYLPNYKIGPRKVIQKSKSIHICYFQGNYKLNFWSYLKLFFLPKLRGICIAVVVFNFRQGTLIWATSAVYLYEIVREQFLKMVLHVFILVGGVFYDVMCVRVWVCRSTCPRMGMQRPETDSLPTQAPIAMGGAILKCRLGAFKLQYSPGPGCELSGLEASLWQSSYLNCFRVQGKTSFRVVLFGAWKRSP